MTDPLGNMYSIAIVSYVEWRNNTLRAEASGRGTEYEVQVQLRQPEPFASQPELVFALPGDAPEIDVLRTDSSYNLISNRMVGLLRDADVQFEVFPARLVDRKTKMPILREYYIFHLQEFVEAIDLTNSTYEYNALLGIQEITKIILSSDFVQDPKLHRPLFYDRDRHLDFFIHNDLRQSFEQHGFTGLTFFNLDTYREHTKVAEMTMKIREPRVRGSRKRRWSNPIYRELSEWLADPAEYGEPPVAIETIHQEKSPWPLFEEDGEIDIAFHRYRMADGQNGIALTGPIIWSFGDTDLEGFSWEELKRFFAGWYIAFFSVNPPNFDWEMNEKEQETLAKSLSASDSSFAMMMDYIRVGELIWYAYRREVAGREEVVITDTKESMTLAADSPYLRLPPLYYFLGSLFFEGKLT